MKRQSKMGVNFPALEAAGRQRRSVPTAIIIRNPRTSVLAGDSRFAFLNTGTKITLFCQFFPDDDDEEVLDELDDELLGSRGAPPEDAEL